MIGRTLSHYEILSEISRGGMGIVYRAVDVKLDREVALKVLPPELVADTERKRRFVQEAKAAAKLDHPHIGMVFEIDEADGTTFMAMELIRGEQLRDTIAKGPVPLRRALDIAIDVAEGLSKAHYEGIVHRDLKPANIMVTQDGHTKIIDFGLAKLVEPLAGEGSDIETLTRGETDPGKVMGTVSYMSPEQARGETVDHRSDIFGFGIVLHEMLTGKLPFRGPSAPETLSAIINSPTPELELPAHKDMAPELQRVMDKCLSKEPEERFQTVKDVVVDLRAARRQLESGTARPAIEKQAKRPWGWVISGAVLAVVVVTALYGLRPSAAPEESGPADSKPSIAVLYFDNASGDPELDWLRTGLTDMLVTDLSQSPSLEILSTDRLFQFLKEMNRLDEQITSLEVVQEVAERANAATIVLGSFMKAGETIRINIRVQDASTGKILSTEKIEGVGESSIFSMVDDLTRRIKNGFELDMAAEEEWDRGIQDVTTSSPEALRYYVESFNFAHRGNNEDAVLLREKAVELDPTFAMALIKLSENHNNLGHRKSAEEYARRALEHSDRLPARERFYIEAYYYALRRGTWDRAIDAYQQALRLDPNSGSSRNNMAWRLRDFEHVDEAIEHFEELRRRQWPSPYSPSHLAICYGLKGQFDSGYRVLEEYLRQHPDNSTGYALLGRYLTFGGKLDEALDSFRRAESLDPGNFYVYSHRHPLFILLEDWEGAEKDAKWMMTLGDPVRESIGLRRLGSVRLHQGRSKEALDSLDQAEAASADPTNIARSCVIAAYVLLAEGELTRALEKAQRAQHEGKNDLPEWQGLFYGALAQARLDRWDDAVNSAEELKNQAEALPTEIEKRRYHHLIGELALVRGDAAEAIKELSEAGSTLLPRWHDYTNQHVPIWYSLAHAYLESGDEEGAAEWFRRIVESSIEHVWWPIEYVRSFYFLGKIHENRGDIEKAREYYRRFYEYWKDGDMDRERVEDARKKLAA